jgi:hypothetical protein
MPILDDLVRALQNSEIEIIDLTADLSSGTPLLPLPPQWPNTPAFQLRRARARLVLELVLDRRTHGHALRRSHPLDQRQGSSR